MGNIIFNNLKGQKVSFLFWALGIVALVVLYIAFYPSIKESAAALQAYIDKMPEALRTAFVGSGTDYVTPVGYLTSEVFTFMTPLLFIVFALIAGSGAVAGEEEKGTLDILLSNPISRWQILVEKFVAMCLSVTILAAILALTLIIGSPTVDLDVSPQRILDMVISVELLALAFGSVSLFLGAATGIRAVSIGITGALMVVSFLVNALAPVVDFLKDLQKFSPFFHYIGDNPLLVGLQGGHVLVLLGITILCLSLSVIAFERRDLRI